MSKRTSKGRRQLLLGAGALLAGAAVGSRLVHAGGAPASGRVRSTRRALASILPHRTNPYFIAQGGPAIMGGSAGAGMAASSGSGTSGVVSLDAAVRAALGAATTVPSTLVLYDTTGQWGWLGELYAIMAANLAGHFGTWTAMPVVSYTAGLLKNFTACVYVGSTYDEPIPTAFLSDVFAATSTKIIWMYDNIWQLTAMYPQFATQYGFLPWVFDFSTVATVTYNGQSLTRYSENGAGIMSYSTVGGNATVLAEAVRSDSTTFPWAISSGSLTYVGENPFVYISEGDRYLIFTDLLFDALAPTTATKHLALVRLEDIDPTADPTELKATADWLYANKIPFGFQVIARYLDPNGYYNNGVAEDISMHTVPTVVSALKYLQQKGGTMICHGYTHQYSNIDNPYTGVTGDDCEFYSISSNNGVLTYNGPLPPDTGTSWAAGRFASYKSELAASGFKMPSLVTFPDYAASVPDYQAAKSTFTTRAERSLYFTGVLTGQPINYGQMVGQFFPYSVTDVYGSRVLADSLGGIDPTTYFGIPPRLPAQILAAAQSTLAVRNGYGSFFYNPEDPISYLEQTVEGLQALGYTFVSPATA
jgi:uncharacterized protein YdaL